MIPFVQVLRCSCPPAPIAGALEVVRDCPSWYSFSDPAGDPRSDYEFKKVADSMKALSSLTNSQLGEVALILELRSLGFPVASGQDRTSTVNTRAEASLTPSNQAGVDLNKFIFVNRFLFDCDSVAPPDYVYDLRWAPWHGSRKELLWPLSFRGRSLVLIGVLPSSKKPFDYAQNGSVYNPTAELDYFARHYQRRTDEFFNDLKRGISKLR